jgi:hypothetical protein
MTADRGGAPGAAPALTCPLCGAPVNPGEAACGACPMSRGCGMICCARCGYRFVERSAVVDWIGRVWRRLQGGAARAGGPQGGPQRGGGPRRP